MFVNSTTERQRVAWTAVAVVVEKDAQSAITIKNTRGVAAAAIDGVVVQQPIENRPIAECRNFEQEESGNAVPNVKITVAGSTGGMIW